MSHPYISGSVQQIYSALMHSFLDVGMCPVRPRNILGGIFRQPLTQPVSKSKIPWGVAPEPGRSA